MGCDLHGVCERSSISDRSCIPIGQLCLRIISPQNIVYFIEVELIYTNENDHLVNALQMKTTKQSDTIEDREMTDRTDLRLESDLVEWQISITKALSQEGTKAQVSVPCGSQQRTRERPCAAMIEV